MLRRLSSFFVPATTTTQSSVTPKVLLRASLYSSLACQSRPHKVSCLLGTSPLLKPASAFSTSTPVFKSEAKKYGRRRASSPLLHPQYKDSNKLAKVKTEREKREAKKVERQKRGEEFMRGARSGLNGIRGGNGSGKFGLKSARSTGSRGWDASGRGKDSDRKIPATSRRRLAGAEQLRGTTERRGGSFGLRKEKIGKEYPPHTADEHAFARKRKGLDVKNARYESRDFFPRRREQNRNAIEEMLDGEFDRRSLTSSSPDSNYTSKFRHSRSKTPSSASFTQARNAFTSPPLLPGLRQSVLAALGDNAVPTPIQSLALQHLFPLTQSDQQSRGDREKEREVVEDSNEQKWREVLLASETGSGKTYAYLLPTMQHLKATESQVVSSTPIPSEPTTPINPRALILAPTHELARQLAASAKSLVHYEKLRVLCASRPNARNKPSDGWKETRNDSDLQRPIDILVATPAKAYEMLHGHTWAWGQETMEEAKSLLERGARMAGKPVIGLERIEVVVVDEADVLIDVDFRDTLLDLLSSISAARGHLLPSNRNLNKETYDQNPRDVHIPYEPVNYPFHLLLSSATVPSSLSAYLTSAHPKTTRLISPGVHRLPPGLETEHAGWSGGSKIADVEKRLRRVWAEDALRGKGSKKSKVLIFCNRATGVEHLAAGLEERGIKCVPLAGSSSSRSYGSNAHIEPFLKSAAGQGTNAGRRHSGQGVPRERVKEDEPDVLITTSFLSRGLDFSPDVRHVFVLDPPRNMIDFVHRAGRTARAGLAGRVVIFGKLKGRGSLAARDLQEKVKALATH